MSTKFDPATVSRDDMISLEEARQYFGSGISRMTLYKWRTMGKQTLSGKRAKIRFWSDGTKLFTTEEEIIRFKRELNT